MRGRYKKRVQYEALANFSNNDLTGQGRVIDLTVPGCQIECTQRVLRGQYLELQISLPGGTSAIAVKLAAVRWTKGNRFGVEFIRMGRSDQEVLETFMAEHAHE